MIYSWKLPRGNFSVCQKQLKKNFFFYWGIADLQCYVSFRCKAKWITYTYTYIHFCKILFPYRSWQSVPKATLKGITSHNECNWHRNSGPVQNRPDALLRSTQPTWRNSLGAAPLLWKFFFKNWLHCMWDLSSPIRNRTGVPWTGRLNLNCWTTREVPRAALQELSAFSLPASPLTWMRTASATAEPQLAASSPLRSSPHSNLTSRLDRFK